MHSDETRKWGIPLETLNGGPEFELHYVPPEYATKPILTVNLAEKFEPYREQIEERWGLSADLRGKDRFFSGTPYVVDSYEKLRQKSRDFPLDPYFSEFSFDELAKYMFGDVVMSEVSEAFQRTRDSREYIEIPPPEPAEFVYKLRNSMHHYWGYTLDWNNLVDAYYAIPQFTFASDFEVRFDHSRYFNEWGSAQHVEDQILKLRRTMPWKEYANYFHYNTVYLDGVFGYLIHHKDKHVLTIGFSVGHRRIFINQIQVRQPKGNRWIYSLPCDLLNYCVSKMYYHFAAWGFDIYLVDGNSAATKIAKQHAKDNPLPQEVRERIAAFYSQPLGLFRRGDIYHRQGLDFYRLELI